VKIRLFTQYSISLLGILALLGCAALNTSRNKDPSNRPRDDYIVFGLSVFCSAADSRCLKEQLDSCLGQTRKQHIRENGRPAKLTLLAKGGAMAEWPLRGSKDSVSITYDRTGIARKWSFGSTHTPLGAYQGRLGR